VRELADSADDVKDRVRVLRFHDDIGLTCRVKR
jgi:hypothetical protein